MWSSINYEYVDSVKKALEEIGRVCPRCILRLAGVKNSREHKAAEPERKTNPETVEAITKIFLKVICQIESKIILNSQFIVF